MDIRFDLIGFWLPVVLLLPYVPQTVRRARWFDLVAAILLAFIAAQIPWINGGNGVAFVPAGILYFAFRMLFDLRRDVFPAMAWLPIALASHVGTDYVATRKLAPAGIVATVGGNQWADGIVITITFLFVIGFACNAGVSYEKSKPSGYRRFCREVLKCYSPGFSWDPGASR